MLDGGWLGFCLRREGPSASSCLALSLPCVGPNPNLGIHQCQISWHGDLNFTMPAIFEGNTKASPYYCMEFCQIP